MSRSIKHNTSIDSNPHNFSQIFRHQSDYQKHLQTLQSIHSKPGRIDQRQPESSKLTHLRPKRQQEEQQRRREIQAQNDQLVLKILRLRGRTAGRDLNVTVVHRSQVLDDHTGIRSERSTRRPGAMRNSTMYRTGGLHEVISSRTATPAAKRGSRGRRGSASSGRASTQGAQRRRPGSKTGSRRSNSAMSNRRETGNILEGHNQHMSGYDPNQKQRLVNVCFIDKPRPVHNQSLNYINRKNEQAKQLEENLYMLKKIHDAKPTIKNSEYKKHEEKVQKLKKMVSDGSNRLSLVQVARDQVLFQHKSIFMKQHKKMPEFGGLGLANLMNRNEKKQSRTLWTSADKMKKGRNNLRYQAATTSGQDYSSSHGVSATLKGAKFRRSANQMSVGQQQNYRSIEYKGYKTELHNSLEQSMTQDQQLNNASATIVPPSVQEEAQSSKNLPQAQEEQELASLQQQNEADVQELPKDDHNEQANAQVDNQLQQELGDIAEYRTIDLPQAEENQLVEQPLVAPVSQGTSFNSQKARNHRDLRSSTFNNTNSSARGTLGQIKEWKQAAAFQIYQRAQLPLARRSLGLANLEFSHSELQHMNSSYTRPSNWMKKRNQKRPSQQKFQTIANGASESYQTQLRQKQVLPRIQRVRGAEGSSQKFGSGAAGRRGDQNLVAQQSNEEDYREILQPIGAHRASSEEKQLAVTDQTVGEESAASLKRTELTNVNDLPPDGRTSNKLGERPSTQQNQHARRRRKHHNQLLKSNDRTVNAKAAALQGPPRRPTAPLTGEGDDEVAGIAAGQENPYKDENQVMDGEVSGYVSQQRSNGTLANGSKIAKSRINKQIASVCTTSPMSRKGAPSPLKDGPHMPAKSKPSLGGQKRKFLQEYSTKMQKFQAGVKTSKYKPPNSLSLAQTEGRNNSRSQLGQRKGEDAANQLQATEGEVQESQINQLMTIT